VDEPRPTARRAVAAYGGEARWRAASEVVAELTVRGWAFRRKGRSPLRRIQVRAGVWQPALRIEPFGGGDRTAVLQGNDVRIEAAGGQVIHSRMNAGRSLSGRRRRLWWDELDKAYFVACALWNDLTLPALLLNREIEWTELSPGRLEGIFPPHLPTPGRSQRFEFDIDTSLLRQHDHTAAGIGSGEPAASVVVAHEHWGEIPYPARCRVTPRAANGSPRRSPVLIDLDVHSWELR